MYQQVSNRIVVFSRLLNGDPLEFIFIYVGMKSVSDLKARRIIQVQVFCFELFAFEVFKMYSFSLILGSFNFHFEDNIS